MTQFDPALLSQPDRYKFLIGAIVPRPIAFVSTRSPEGKLNLAPFSFFAGVGSEPMSLLFCPANKADGSEKDSLRNAKPVIDGGTGEFVVNVASELYEREVAACAEPLAYGESEFALSSLTPSACVMVAPPRVAESPISFECRTLQVIRLAPGLPAGGNIVIGQVVYIHAREDVVNERLHVNPDKLAAIARMGGSMYVRTSDAKQRFEMPQGKAAIGKL
ncbi:MAG: flavin reductase family protein [Pyrinomonadaceae bacterium]|nr:flavin reductase family protein [Phycisphaerales bacterium]